MATTQLASLTPPIFLNGYQPAASIEFWRDIAANNVVVLRYLNAAISWEGEVAFSLNVPVRNKERNERQQ